MKVNNGITNRAALLLGLMTAEARPDGTYSAPRKVACRRLGWSDATLGRTLKRLHDCGEISVVTPGGGAGRPTVYRITRLAREQVERIGQRDPSGDARSVPNRASGSSSGTESAHLEGVLDGVQGIVSCPHLPDPDFMALGRGVTDFLAGVVRGAYDHWSRLSPVGRAVALAPATCGAGWAIVRRTLAACVATL